LKIFKKKEAILLGQPLFFSSLDVSGLKPGIYITNIHSNEKSIVSKCLLSGLKLKIFKKKEAILLGQPLFIFFKIVNYSATTSTMMLIVTSRCKFKVAS